MQWKVFCFHLRTPLLMILSDKAVCWSHKEKYKTKSIIQNIRNMHCNWFILLLLLPILRIIWFSLANISERVKEESEENSLYTASPFPQKKSGKWHLWFTVLIMYGNNFAKFLKKSFLLTKISLPHVSCHSSSQNAGACNLFPSSDRENETF